MNSAIGHAINAGGKLIDLGKPQVMGILNVTPDSFFAGSRKQTEKDIAGRAAQIVAEGGAMIDVGAFSTRPGAAVVTVEEEMERLRFGLAIVRREQPEAVVSVDTFRPEVARMAVEEYGADIINDVSGGNPDGAYGGTATAGDASDMSADAAPHPMFAMVARLGVPYVLTSSAAGIIGILLEVSAKVRILHSLGVKDIIMDPGFGFGKSVDDNFAVMGGMEKLCEAGLPVLVGVSRKSMITRVTGRTADEALNGTTALNAIALTKGASILRVHDVREAVECVEIVGALRRASAQ